MAVTVARALAAAVDELVVVTAAPGIQGLLAAHGVSARCLADPGTGLNPALSIGVEELLARDCGLVVACMADLPALTAADVTAALAECVGPGRWFVPDAESTGTTLLAARGRALNPAFGPDSASRHRAGGAVELAGTPALRRDVDDAADLGAAARIGLQLPVSMLIGAEGRTVHDTAVVIGRTAAGWELIISGGARTMAPPSAVGADLRTLATGQRVHLARDADGSVRHVWL